MRSKQMRLHARVSVWLLLAVVTVAVLVIASAARSSGRPADASQAENEHPTVRFTVADAAVVSSKDESPAEVAGTPLSMPRVLQLLSRLQPLEEKKQPKLTIPEQSLIRPKPPGIEVIEPFPPPAGAASKVRNGESARPVAKPVVQPLTISRPGTRGPVESIKELSIDFSQPMVPVGTIGSDAGKIVKLEPQPPGQWHWAGAQTLVFNPDAGSFPRATEYRVTVPAGTQSALGGRLAKTESWTILTPPVSCQRYYPQGAPQPQSPLMVATFDQPIDPEAIVGCIKLSTKGSEFAVRLVAADKAKQNEEIKNLVSEVPENQWLCFEPVEPLPRATDVTVTIGPGCQSLEGPRKSTASQSYMYHVYSPLQVNDFAREVRPDEGATRCIGFNNPLDLTKLPSGAATLLPAEPGVTLQAEQYGFCVVGRLKPHRKYQVTLDPNITDIFGQKLGHKTTIRFRTTSYIEVLKADQQFITIPAGRQRPVCKFWAQSTGELKLTVYRATPESFLSYNYTWFTKPNVDKISLPVVARKTIRPPEEGRLVYLNLERYLTRSFGFFLVVAQADRAKKLNPVYTWVQVTDIGLDAFYDENLHVFASSLTTGLPDSEARVRLLPQGATAQVDQDGFCQFALSENADVSRLLVASRGADLCVLGEGPSPGWSGWSYRKRESIYRWYAVTDRNLYQPGERVNVKGWLREESLDAKHNGAIKLQNAPIESVNYTVSASDGSKISDGSALLDQWGGFSFSVSLPEKVNLGNASITISGDDALPLQSGKIAPGTRHGRRRFPAEEARSIPLASANVSFSIQEFRRPEFEMKVLSDGAVVRPGDKARVQANARYLSGAALRDAEVRWTVTAMRGKYAPPGWQEFSFGPCWRYFGRHRRLDWRRQYDANTQEFVGETDHDGSQAINVQVQSADFAGPVSLVCEGTVRDLNQQEWSDRITTLMHTADYYVGLKTKSWNHVVGEPFKYSFVVADIDGNCKPGALVQFKLVKLAAEESKPDIEIESFSRTSAESAIPVEMNIKESGEYTLVATVMDERERKNTTELDFSVAKKQPVKPVDNKGLVGLRTDKTSYKPGDVATLTVKSSFFPAHGIMLLTHGGIISKSPLVLEQASKTITVPILEDYYTSVEVQIDLVGPNDEYGGCATNLSVPPDSRRLSLSAVTKDREMKPGGETTIEVELKDAAGQPIDRGQVAIAVVDEAILALSNYSWYDVMSSFYQGPQSVVGACRLRPSIVRPDELLEQKMTGQTKNRHKGANSLSLPKEIGAVEGPRDMNLFQVEPSVVDERHYTSARGSGQLAQLSSVDKYTFFAGGRGGIARRGQAKSSLLIRSNFDSLALFAPHVLTDGDGKAQVHLRLPDSVTRYRIMAAAVGGTNRFGMSESTITARLPLTVRPSPPRFLNFGDRCDLPVVVENETDGSLPVEVVMRTAGASLSARKGPSLSALPDQLPPEHKGEPEPEDHCVGRMIQLAAHHRAQLRFPVTADEIGKARFQCAAISGDRSDASAFAVPVMLPATLETFATYGEVDKGAALQKFEQPKDVFKEIGGLSVTTSSTALQSLTDAYMYLYDYPYGCTEQISSRMIATLSLQDVLGAFGKLTADEQSEVRHRVQADIDEIVTRQDSDGGFGLWKRGEEYRFPYVSLQAARALKLAEEKQYVVSKECLRRCREYLQQIEQHIPSGYSRFAIRSIVARALSIRHELKDDDAAAARGLISEALQDAAAVSRLSQAPKLSEIPIDTFSQELPLECAGWLLPVLSRDSQSTEEVQALRRLIDSQITQTASTASTNCSGYGEWNFCLFFSPRRCDAIVLEALMEDQPESPLIAKLARGLLAHRKNGMWEGTQENGYILQALDRYFNRYEKETPDFVCQAWLGETLVALQKYKGRSTESKVVNVPMSYLVSHQSDDILIDKDGPGRLYYRLALDYAPRRLDLKPASLGFDVTRTYEPVDSDSDVTRDSQGTWHFKRGATVRSILHFKVEGPRYHVALIDPLPGGAEPVNAALAGNRSMRSRRVSERVSERSPARLPEGSPLPDGCESPEWPGLWRRHLWYEHQNLRNHEAEAFASMLTAGQYSYTYLMRATTPGDYRAAPAKAEETYAPETFGRSGTEHVIIE